MATPLSTLADLDRLDQLASRDTPVNRLDPRVKLIATAAFILCVVSFERHTVSALLPFLIFPVALAARGDIPIPLLAGKIAPALPFALLAGILNPLLDREIVMIAGTVPVGAGWLSFCSIGLRCLLTVSAALVLLATTGLHGICHAMERLGAPRPFVLQLLFMYRYLSVLGGEASRMALARQLRSCGARGGDHGSAAAAIGSLLARSMERSRRINEAMLARGFRGSFPERSDLSPGRADGLFLAGWCALFGVLRIYDIPALAGRVIGRYLA